MKELDKLIGFEDETQEESNIQILPPNSNLPSQIENNTPLDEKAEEDFEFGRTSIRQVISNASDVLDVVETIARDTENPQAFQAYNSILKTIVDSSKTLMDMHKTKRELKKPYSQTQNMSVAGDASSTTTTIQNAVFTGNPKELQKLLDSMEEDES